MRGRICSAANVGQPGVPLWLSDLLYESFLILPMDPNSGVPPRTCRTSARLQMSGTSAAKLNVKLGFKRLPPRWHVRKSDVQRVLLS